MVKDISGKSRRRDVLDGSNEDEIPSDLMGRSSESSLRFFDEESPLGIGWGRVRKRATSTKSWSVSRLCSVLNNQLC